MGCEPVDGSSSGQSLPGSPTRPEAPVPSDCRREGGADGLDAPGPPGQASCAIASQTDGFGSGCCSGGAEARNSGLGAIGGCGEPAGNAGGPTAGGMSGRPHGTSPGGSGAGPHGGLPETFGGRGAVGRG